ncbi:hypothetical protein [Fluviispira vulneris]|uniref:hypothetical protein n=1 Tax=Fluviispira vulneris TaxID=2763012 RepID=UPI00164964F3|nr:hypothetical protein [Fluviispira vulneris]
MSEMQTPEAIVNMVSLRLREIIHDINNALFVTKGFLEELSDDVKEKKYADPKFDHENFNDMIATISRNVEKIDQNLIKLRKFAKEEVFEKTGVTKTV